MDTVTNGDDDSNIKNKDKNFSLFQFTVILLIMLFSPSFFLIIIKLACRNMHKGCMQTF